MQIFFTTLVLLILLVSNIQAKGCVKKPSPVGSDCTSSMDCLTRICNDKKCAAINLVAKGAECDGDYRCLVSLMNCPFKNQKTCAAGLHCKGYKVFPTETLGTCEVMPKVGEPCDPNADVPCISGLCGKESKTCIPYRSLPIGAACTSSECSGNAPCVNGTCAVAKKDGEICSNSGVCEIDSLCTGSKCQKRPTADASCTTYAILFKTNGSAIHAFPAWHIAPIWTENAQL